MSDSPSSLAPILGQAGETDGGPARFERCIEQLRRLNESLAATVEQREQMLQTLRTIQAEVNEVIERTLARGRS